MRLPAMGLRARAEGGFKLAIQHALAALKRAAAAVRAARERRAAYVELGAMYVAGSRFTKACRHYQQGVELFSTQDLPSAAHVSVAFGLALRSRLRLEGGVSSDREAVGWQIEELARAGAAFAQAHELLGIAGADAALWRQAEAERGARSSSPSATPRATTTPAASPRRRALRGGGDAARARRRAARRGRRRVPPRRAPLARAPPRRGARRRGRRRRRGCARKRRSRTRRRSRRRGGLARPAALPARARAAPRRGPSTTSSSSSSSSASTGAGARARVSARWRSAPRAPHAAFLHFSFPLPPPSARGAAAAAAAATAAARRAGGGPATATATDDAQGSTTCALVARLWPLVEAELHEVLKALIVEHGGDRLLFKRMYRLALVQRDTLGTDMLQQLAVEWGEQADAS